MARQNNRKCLSEERRLFLPDFNHIGINLQIFLLIRNMKYKI